MHRAIISHSLPRSLGASYLPILAFSQILHCSSNMLAYYFWMCHLSFLDYYFFTISFLQLFSALRNTRLRWKKNQRLHEEKFSFGYRKLLEYLPNCDFVFLDNVWTSFLFLSDLIKMCVKILGVDFVPNVCFCFDGLCLSCKEVLLRPFYI